MIYSKLKEHAEPGYKAFSEKLFDKKPNMLGVRIPTVKKISKEFLTYDIDELLNLNITYLEEKFVILFCIANKKISLEEKLKYLDKAIYLIDNWSLCDTFCAALKIKTEEDKIILFKYIKKLLSSKEEYKLRVAFVMLKNNFISNEYIDFIFSAVLRCNSEFYYVKMAISWLLATVYNKFPKEVITFLSTKDLDTFILNKSISKICDSRLVTKKEKEYLKTLKS